MTSEHQHTAPASGIPGVRRNRNLAERAANARLARVMASQANADAEEEEEEEDDDDGELHPSSAGAGGGFRFGLPRPAASSDGGGVSLLGRTARSPSPAFTRNIVENAPGNRSSSAGRSSLSIRTAPMVPQVKTTLTTAAPIPAIEPPLDRHRGFFSDDNRLTRRVPGEFREASALQDQVDMLESENYNLLEMLQLVEERCTETEARSRELEKQVLLLRDPNFFLSVPFRKNYFVASLSLKERQHQAARSFECEAMRTAMRNKDDRSEEMTKLQQQLQSSKSEVANAMDHLRETESEAKALKIMTQRMILTQEEMEEVVLKRCWLARYWSLAVQHDFRSPCNPKFIEAFELCQEEAEDVHFKQALLLYFWRKAKTQINPMGETPTSHDAVDVERGLIELRKLGIEQQLWEASRKEINVNQKLPTDAENS